MEERMQGELGKSLNKDILKSLDAMLRNVNPLASLYKTAYEKFESAKEKNRRLNKPVFFYLFYIHIFIYIFRCQISA